MNFKASTEHYWINTINGKTVKVPNHELFLVSAYSHPEKLKQIGFTTEEIAKFKSGNFTATFDFIANFDVMRLGLYGDLCSVGFVKAKNFDVLNQVENFGLKHFHTDMKIEFYKNGHSTHTRWKDLLEDPKSIRLGSVNRKASFYHYFINQNTGKTIKVDSHRDFAQKAKSDPKAKILGIKHFWDGKDTSMRFVNEFIADNNLIRISWYDNEVGITYYGNSSKVFDLIKHFGIQYGFRGSHSLTFDNLNSSRYFSIDWHDFLLAMDDKSGLIVKVSSVVKSRIAGFEHYFLNSRTGQEVKVQSHDHFAYELKEHPSLFKSLDLNVSFFTKEQEKYYKDGAIADYEWIMKIAPLIRISKFGNYGFEYYAATNNKDDVADEIYKFGKRHHLLDFDTLFIGSNTGLAKKYTWKQFRDQYDIGMIKLGSIMNINKELEYIAAAITAGTSSIQNELKDNEDQIFKDLEKEIMSSNRYLKNIKAWVYEEDDLPYFERLTGSLNVPQTKINQILSKYSPSFKKSKEQTKEAFAFFKGFKDLPIEDVNIENYGDWNSDIKDAQASWVLSNGLTVKVDEKQLRERM